MAFPAFWNQASVLWCLVFFVFFLIQEFERAPWTPLDPSQWGSNSPRVLFPLFSES